MIEKDQPTAPLDNYRTGSIGRVDATKDVTKQDFEDLLTRVAPTLTHDTTFVWDANISGVVVRLVTNSRHQYDFWTENWWPGPNDDSVVPHGIIYSISGVPDMEPHAYYCPAKNASLFLNTEYYGQCKSWALGMAAVVLEENFNTHSIHGACAEYGKKGIVIVAPTGTGKTTQVNRLFQDPQGLVVGDDWVYVQHPPTAADEQGWRFPITQPERSLYVRTENALNEPWLGPIFERCRLENVVTNPKDCQHDEDEPCAFDEGDTKCFWGFGNSRAILPREWMLGKNKVADEAHLDLLVLLRRDDESPAEVWLDPEDAVEVLREGKYQIRPGAGPREKWGTFGYEPWYNPYLLKPDHDKQAAFFRKEVEHAACVILNTGPKDETIESTYGRIVKALAKLE